MIKFFYQHVKENVGHLTLSTLLSCLTILSSVGLMGVSAYLIILAGFHPSIAVLQLSIVGVRFFGISRSVFRYLERISNHKLNFLLLGKVRLEVFDHFSTNYQKIIDKYSSSDIFTMILSDIERMENFYVRLISPWFVALITSITIGIFFGLRSIEITFVYLLGFGLTGFVFPFLAIRKATTRENDLNSELGKFHSAVVEFYQSLNEAIFYQSQISLVKEVFIQEKKLQRIQGKNGAWEALWNLLSFLMVQITFLIILLICAKLINEGRMESVLIGVLSLMALSSYEVVTNLSSQSQTYNDVATTLKRFDQLKNMKLKNEISSSFDKLDIKKIELFKVNFSFNHDFDKLILNNINLTIQKGEKIGIIGPNGSGKTTLMEILLGFRKNYDGSICYNGTDLKTISEEQLHSRLNYLSANPYFFNTTIKQNLLLANENINDETMKIILQQVGLYDPPLFDLEREVHEMGKNLSSGQMQKLALAQILIRDGDLFILDEPFANLDPQSIIRLTELIFEILSEKTIILITHDYYQLRFIEKIYKMESGEISFVGNYDNLIDRFKKGEIS